MAETLITQQQTGIAEFLSAMKYDDGDIQTAITLMRKKLVEIQQNESSSSSSSAVTLIKKPPTITKLIIKFAGSKSSLPIKKRPYLETLNSDSRNASEPLISDSRNAGPSQYYSQTLINCKRHKITQFQNPGLTTTDHETRVLINGFQNPSLITDQTRRLVINTERVINVMDFIKSIGGSGAELVIEKTLTASDVTPNLGRLLIPVLQERFLTEEEKAILGEKEDISVCVFDLRRREAKLNLVKWLMSSREYYALKTNWNQIVKTNRLKEGMVIRIFSFRLHHDQKLCFALDRVG